MGGMTMILDAILLGHILLFSRNAEAHVVPDLSFVNVVEPVGVIGTRPSYKFGGPCVADLDNDGYYDLLLSYHNKGKMQIFFGNADGKFTLANFTHHYFDIHGVNVAQRNAISRERILSISLGGGSGGNLKRPLVYLVTPDRKFVEISSSMGLGDVKTRGRSTLFMDMSMNKTRRNKGAPDLLFLSYLGNEAAGLKQFSYQNNGIEFFRRRVPGFENEVRGRVEVTDIDGDMNMEIVSIRELQIYKLVSSFTFADITSEVMPNPYNRGDESFRNTAVVELDYDNNGIFDLYVARADRRLVTRREQYSRGTTNDMLLQNRNGKYVDVSEACGIPKGTNSMGVTAGDFNNDGYVDLLVIQWEEPDFFLINQGDGTFERMDGLIPKRVWTVGNNAVAVDYNLDGRLDAVVGHGAAANIDGPYMLMRNTMKLDEGKNYLLVRVRNAPGRQRTSLHAVITIYVNEAKLSRRVGSSGAQAGGGSYLDTVHFGLGRLTRVDWITVRWTNNVLEEKHGVNANQVVSFGEF